MKKKAVKKPKQKDELTPKQIEFLRLYNDPKSDTFGNALQSALSAGYSQEYAENIMHLFPDWLSDNIGKRKRLLVKAENNLETLLDSGDERVKADITKFVSKTLGKETYSERTELTGADGKDLMPDEVKITQSNDALKQYLNGVNGNTTGK